MDQQRFPQDLGINGGFLNLFFSAILRGLVKYIDWVYLGNQLQIHILLRICYEHIMQKIFRTSKFNVFVFFKYIHPNLKARCHHQDPALSEEDS